MISAVMPVMIRQPWQIPMTRCAIETLRMTAHGSVEIIVVEAGGDHFNGVADKWIEGNRGSYSADWNAGADEASNGIVLHTGNDVFTRPGWDVALKEALALPDCGAATVLTMDIARSVHPIGRTKFSEGVYGPFMAFGSDWRLDAENFPNSFSDTDLVMRMYKAGLRSYRNHAATAEHFLGQTLNGEENRRNFERGRERFMDLHGDSPLLMYKYLSEGHVI